MIVMAFSAGKNPVGLPFRIVAAAQIKSKDALCRLRLPLRLLRPLPFSGHAAHAAKQWITPDCFERVVIAITGPGRRHDHHAVNAALIHQRQSSR